MPAVDKVLSVTSWKNVAKPRIKSTLMPYGFPLTDRLTKYFNNLSCLPILNKDMLHNHNHHTSITNTNGNKPTHIPHTTAVMVFARPTARFTASSVSSSIADHAWCYNVRGRNGGQQISTLSPVDGVLYALHQCLCDGILIGDRTLCHTTHSAFMPYESSQYAHVLNFEPDLPDILLHQQRLMLDYGYLTREFPAIFIVSQTGKVFVDEYNGTEYDILDCEVFKHLNPFTNRVNDVHIITSKHGKDELAKRWHKYQHLKHRELEQVVITDAASEEEPDLVHIDRIGQILYDEPYGIKYLSVEGGMKLVESLVEHDLVHQMNFTLMRKSMVQQLGLSENEISEEMNRFECAQIPYRAAVGFEFNDVEHDCCFTIFDPFQSARG